MCIKILYFIQNAKINTVKYWKKTNDLRVCDSLASLVEDKETSANQKRKVFKKYQSPVMNAIEYNNILSNVRRTTIELRENLREE